MDDKKLASGRVVKVQLKTTFEKMKAKVNKRLRKRKARKWVTFGGHEVDGKVGVELSLKGEMMPPFGTWKLTLRYCCPA